MSSRERRESRAHRVRGRGSARLPWWKKTLFSLVVLVLFFVALEGILALVGVRPVTLEEDPFVGFSTRIPLFVDTTDDSGNVHMMTAQNKLSFFNEQSFAKSKGADTFRIFCVGGSTTYGRPYRASTSFAGWLAAFLPVADPKRHWEVINAGGISYASYRVALVVEELSRYDPDLVVIYSGHNEFLERRTYAALVETPEAVRSFKALLTSTRTWAALSRLVRRPSPATDGARADEPASDDSSAAEGARDLLPGEVQALLDDSVGLEAYTRDDELTANVLEHYRFNLARLIDLTRSGGAKVVVVQPASNIGACAPFKSEHRSGLMPSQIDTFAKTFAAAEKKHGARDHAGALELVEKALAINDRHAHAHYLRGRALRALGRIDEAKEALRRARDEDVCPLRALTSMAAIVADVAAQKNAPLVDFGALMEKLSQEGIADDEFFLDHVHPTIDGHRRLALAIVDEMVARGLVQPGDTWGETAIERVTAEVEASIDHVAHGMALRNLSKVLSWAGKTEEAEKLALRAVTLVPGTALTHHQAGVVLAKRGEYVEAASHHRRAIELEPEFVDGHASLGLALAHVGEFSEAIEHFNFVLERQPRDVKMLNSLGMALAKLRRFEAAASAYERGLSVERGNYKLLTNFGNLLFDRGQLTEARTYYERALAVEPRLAEAHYNLGALLRHEGAGEVAEARFREAIEIRPDYVEAHIQLSQLYDARGEAERAVKQYELALERTPDHAVAHYNLARLLARGGDFTAAIEHYKQALKSNPNYGKAHNNLGVLLARRGNVAVAAEHFEAALAINPDDAEAKSNLERARAMLDAR